ncbi:unnamed protein product, partial [Vitis vinifera]
MSLTEISIIHHVAMVLIFLWLLSSLSWNHPIAYFVSLIYLYQVHEQYIMRMRRKLQFKERKEANRKRVLSDSESVRWLNHAVEKIWPICMEQIVSQKILLPIIPWFLEKYKPWTAKKAIVQHLYMGRNPPMFTEMRVIRESTDDDHLVLGLGMNFLTADDMSAILAIKLRRRLGFGMWAKLHLTGMHVEGKVLIGVKFIRNWPFIGRLRVCFAEPPYFQMTVKPIFTHGLDVTELPGIAGWLDKLLAVAFEQTLVEPNMLVVDVEKFVSPNKEDWFSVDEKEPIALARVEVLEASDMKPSDLNGLADPYVKGKLGPYRFTTKIQKKTLTPKWNEEFKIPICSWELPNMLVIEVRDKDHFVDDTLGACSLNINDLRGGQRHDMWLPLKNIKMGRLHLAITVLEDNEEEADQLDDEEILDHKTLDEEDKDQEDKRNSLARETSLRDSFSSASERTSKVADKYEPINLEGQQETGIWVHHPGSEVSQTWEPRKGKSRHIDSQITGEGNDSFRSPNSIAYGSFHNDGSSTDENSEGKKAQAMNTVRRGLEKIGTVGTESPSQGNVKDMAKCFLKQAGKSARGIKHALSRKGSRKSQGDQEIPVHGNDPVAHKEQVVLIGAPAASIEEPVSETKVDDEGREGMGDNIASSSEGNGDELVEQSSSFEPSVEKLVVSCVIFACHDGYLSIGCIYLYSMWTNNVQPKRFTASFINFKFIADEPYTAGAGFNHFICFLKSTLFSFAKHETTAISNPFCGFWQRQFPQKSLLSFHSILSFFLKKKN